MRTCNVYKSIFHNFIRWMSILKPALKLESLAAVQLCEINSKLKGWLYCGTSKFKVSPLKYSNFIKMC